MLAPFWGTPVEEEQDPVRGRYDAYAAAGETLFSLVGFDDADAVVLPAHWEHIDGNPAAEAAARELDARCARAGKPLVVFFVSDSVKEVPLPHAVVYRTSLLRSRPRPNERALPAFAQDLAAAYPERDVPRPWRPRPAVSFCGLAPHPEGLRRAARSLRSHLTGAQAQDGSIRWRACAALRHDARLDTAFILREQFWGGAVRSDGDVDVDTMIRVRKEYVANVFDADYVLCARGGGNFSYRLYETLAAGRVPLFVDTDCVLPFETDIDWRSMVVWVDEHSVEHAADLLLREHESVSGDAFVERQHRCRDVFAEALSVQGFFRRLAAAPLR